MQPNPAAAPCDPAHYINRELSWLEFNQRVLEEAQDPSNPLLERLKFLCITSSNLDEFFEVRVAGLRQQRSSGVNQTGPDGLGPNEALNAISQRVRRMVADQYRLWNEELAPELEKHGIFFMPWDELTDTEREHYSRYFHNLVYPVLTPLAVDPVHPFPQLLNKSLNVAVELEGDDLSSNLGVVQVPPILPRPVHCCAADNGTYRHVFVGTIIQAHVHALFHGMTVRGAYPFRVTRNSDLYLDEEEADNLLQAIEVELRKRNRGAAVRLEIQRDCPQHITDQLLQTFGLTEAELFRVDGPINLLRFMPVINALDRPELRYRPFVPRVSIATGDHESVFSQIRRRPILLHHPYDSFQSVVEFIEDAAEDPQVLAIKHTLYRTSGDSPIVAALSGAAQSGKQVTVIIELKARFDEAANIRWTRTLQEAGVHVVFGIVGLKTHAKLAMVVRNEEDGIRRYLHLGTGNYHPSTARFYTDLALLTCDPALTADCAELFNWLTGLAVFPDLQKVKAAPKVLRDFVLEMIGRETEHARAGRPASIFVKVNALVDPGVIQALYTASQAGVEVRLLVRGICCLRSGIPGVSDRITVRSIVGRFLEHSRIYRFENGGKPEFYLASADWMPRNLFRRVETCFPVEDPALKEQLERIVDVYWHDNVKARQQGEGLTYDRLPQDGKPFDAQTYFLEEATKPKRPDLDAKPLPARISTKSREPGQTVAEQTA